jgi:hypothetical protein
MYSRYLNSKIVNYIIKSRNETFCATLIDCRPRRSRIRQLGEAQKERLNDIHYFILKGIIKKIGHELLLQLQFSNFQAPVILPSSLIAIILLVLEGSIILVNSTKV